MEKTFESVRNLIANKLETDATTISLDSKLSELGLDSLDIFDIIFDAEEQFGIKVPDQTDAIESVQDVVNILDKLIAEQKKS